ncbi:Signal peptidase I [Schinkia azotoformans MEV2011]|uniref:Signal peptidase I n=1 Tax=Schinkia azotoformans MEV2011 TaxID=1348973 RepID=A0A072NKF2_SCHAZ|nr:signal peptidase I [Schinkia azotoformans]KEF37747.1 Signal peptidase I [Schinkia azotoformans MEV2011]MEC1695633.1 signal peptidase I [Schinkia azotoformans]MEC1717196.1 signal peptidase I [Schinkia azotoformans]MEC1726548.1 signal peptidase I [Schinkia azotoformans]MEC1742010.1 signal peptidase I [Schinkia azotoformans]
MKKVWKVISGLTTTTLFLLLIVMVIAVISSKASGGGPNLFGYQLKPVFSGSMEPTFMTGSIIAVKPVEDPTRLKKDDVITFMESQDKLVTHRIIEVIGNGENIMFRTKGDNVESPDSNPVLARNVVGEYTGFTIPNAGYFMDFARSAKGAVILLILPGVLLLLYSAVSIFKGLKELEKATRKTENDNPVING